MAKKAKVNKNYLWILTIVVIIVIFGAYLLSSKQTHTINSSVMPKQNETTTYKSKLLKITIDVPLSYSIEEKFATITLKREKGQIILDRGGTNFDNLDDYLDDLSERNHFKINNKENIVINNQSTIKGDIDGDRYYFIYVNNQVFSIWTNAPALFFDLDQIARSFRYTP